MAAKAQRIALAKAASCACGAKHRVWRSWRAENSNVKESGIDNGAGGETLSHRGIKCVSAGKRRGGDMAAASAAAAYRRYQQRRHQRRKHQSTWQWHRRNGAIAALAA